jgi:hypothetical protein
MTRTREKKRMEETKGSREMLPSTDQTAKLYDARDNVASGATYKLCLKRKMKKG